jgi:hypothetical protein
VAATHHLQRFKHAAAAAGAQQQRGLMLHAILILSEVLLLHSKHNIWFRM